MNDPSLNELTPAYRLALAYAPARVRDETLAFMLLDQRLAGVVRASGEPMIAQMKLAWWRDRLREDPGAWPGGEPLLARLSVFGRDAAALEAMVDSWELLLGENLGQSQLAEFAAGRNAGWMLLARRHGGEQQEVRQAAEMFALVDLSLNLSDTGEAQAARDMAWPKRACRLPRSRALRPLAVLGALAHRNLAKGTQGLLDGPRALAIAMRIGLTGR